MADRYICIHGHFYQPPRENAWLETVEMQDSADPYHDWNERVNAECYAPNTASRILDSEGRIIRLVNNYQRISFNMGPTLLSWMQEADPDAYAAILAADRISQETFSGHGSAIAQAYNHMIMPLSNRRDKITQVKWGIRDFEHRFSRAPEGMWLPETAVDNETLDIMAEHGIKFTVLTPYQAARFRRIGSEAWEETEASGIDPTRAYRVALPSGRSIALFFYDGPISRAVAFEGLLRSGESFAERLMEGYHEHNEGPQLMHIATDGESYGHHHRFGDMALAYALHHIETEQLARITNYGEFLELHPPEYEAELHEATSWSCAHGVERWHSNCGCNSGRLDWHQAWRGPLRRALDWLRDSLAPLYETSAGRFFADPWAVRDGYIDVILDRSPENTQRFLERYAVRPLTDEEQLEALKLLELQRHAMLMYTSCGWFFDELSGIETVQVIQYAGRALQLAAELLHNGVEAHFLELLEQARGNSPEYPDGRTIFERFVRPAVVDWEAVGAHYAVSSLFQTYAEETEMGAFRFRSLISQSFELGRAKLVLGQIEVASKIIVPDGVRLSYGALHLGDHNVNSGVRIFRGDEAYEALVEETAEVFSQADFAETIRLMDRHFGESSYSLKSLFKDKQREVLRAILESSLAEAEGVYRQLYEQHAPLLRFHRELSLPIPTPLRMAAELFLNLNLRRNLSDGQLDQARVAALLEEARRLSATLDASTLSYTLTRTLERLSRSFAEAPEEIERLSQLKAAVALAKIMPFSVELWKVQNAYWLVQQTIVASEGSEGSEGPMPQLGDCAQEWLEMFHALGDMLGFRQG